MQGSLSDIPHNEGCRIGYLLPFSMWPLSRLLYISPQLFRRNWSICRYILGVSAGGSEFRVFLHDYLGPTSFQFYFNHSPLLYRGLKPWTLSLWDPNNSSHRHPFLFYVLIQLTFCTSHPCLFMLSETSSNSLKDHKTLFFDPESLHHSYSCFDLYISKQVEILHKG